ncbi:YibE/F family protein, partial [Spirillospora albida]|uniref:YibE/F family protein n=1 Tax=Spirillospora albida TaxID=58123 RepID=UPI0004C064F1
MGADHVHGGDTEMPRSRTTVRAVLAIIVPLAVATLVALIWMWPAEPAKKAPGGGQLTKVSGTVTRIHLKPCPEAAGTDGAPVDVRGLDPGASSKTDPRRCGTAAVEITSGDAKGRVVSAELPSGPGGRVFSEGDDVTLTHAPGGPGGAQYLLSDHDRSSALWLVAAAFALAVIAFGRWRGVTALAGLAVTFALLLLFLIPAILEGRPPLLVAIVCASAIMLAVLYLTHGFRVTTSIAVIGTMASLLLTGALATAAISLTHLTGITDDSSFYLDYSYHINTQGLLLASIIIGSLGVLDDVTVTQVATVAELAHANPSSGFRKLYRAAARVGRAHIASVINTIVLAYAGASLPLLLLFTIADQPLGDVLTNPAVAQEIVRSVAGTLGLIAAVPITTALAALAVRPAQSGGDEPDGRGDHPRRPAPAEFPDPLTDRSYF